MIISKPSLITALQAQAVKRPPFWYMRQAGRYLPEYKQLRSTAKNFLDFCYTPDKAAEATLQPIKRFGMDAAIIFSDILVIPHALGMEVWFEEGKGPQLTPIRNAEDLQKLSLDKLVDFLAPVYEAIGIVSDHLDEQTALIGFAGSPWTLACYMLEGKGSRDFQMVRSFAFRQPDVFSQMMDLLVDAVALHLQQQVAWGAQALQLFDSWSGILSEAEFHAYVIEPTRRIVEKLRISCPDIPLIGFARQAGVKIKTYAQATGVDAVAFDHSVTREWVSKELAAIPVQGNLDPLMLAEDLPKSLEQAKRLLEIFTDKSFVFNLSHGILPHTPPAHVEALSQLLRG